MAILSYKRKALIAFQKRENEFKRYSEYQSKKEIDFWKNLSEEKINIWYGKFFVTQTRKPMATKKTAKKAAPKKKAAAKKKAAPKRKTAAKKKSAKK